MNYGHNVSGNATVSTQTSGDIIAAPGTGIVMHIQKVAISVSVVAASSTVALDDGTTTYWKVATADDTIGMAWTLDFGDAGFALAANKALKLTVAGGNATAYAMAVGYTR